MAPTPEFARGLRSIADAAGAMLVLDEIRTTCRVGSAVGGGHWSELGPGTAPDMCVHFALPTPVRVHHNFGACCDKECISL